MTLKGIVGPWWMNAHQLKKNLFYACKSYMSVTKAGFLISGIQMKSMHR